MTLQDNDAAGYAAHDKDGNLFGERWLNVNLALKTAPKYEVDTESLTHETNGIISPLDQYSSFGTVNKDKIKSLILHSRFATCDKNIENAHPFVNEDGTTALIHNGVVNRKGLNYITSTCDSEGILNEYTDQEVSTDYRKIQQVANKIKGSYACAVLGTNTDGNYLDLFRNDQYPTLFTCFVKQLGTYVYATEASMIEQAVYDLGWSIDKMMFIKDHSFLRIDVDMGTIMESTTIVPEKKAKHQLRRAG